MMKKESRINTDSFGKTIGDKEKRKLQAQRERKSVWAGLGLFGMVGWSITVPAIGGAALGVWLDKNYKQTFSWTLSLLVVGLMVGALIAWNWVQKENKEIHKKEAEETNDSKKSI